MKVLKISALIVVGFVCVLNVVQAKEGFNIDKNNYAHKLINKFNAIEKSFVPENLVIPNTEFVNHSGNHKIDANVAVALETMFGDAKKEDVMLKFLSGYRSYEAQEALFNRTNAKQGKAQKSVAPPGHSEHQSGLAVDVNSLSKSFGKTKEGIWLAENSYKYGFIIRYPEDKTEITGYIYEPWHLRYVGIELATYCFYNKMTLEEVFAEISEKNLKSLLDAKQSDTEE